MVLVVASIGSEGLLGTEVLQSCLPHQLLIFSAINTLTGAICEQNKCNEFRVIWPVSHEILSVITRSTIIT